jgi:hypothetical protein
MAINIKIYISYADIKNLILDIQIDNYFYTKYNSMVKMK